MEVYNGLQLGKSSRNEGFTWDSPSKTEGCFKDVNMIRPSKLLDSPRKKISRGSVSTAFQDIEKLSKKQIIVSADG